MSQPLRLAALVLTLALLAACNPLKPELVDSSLGKIQRAALFTQFTSRTGSADPASLAAALHAELARRQAGPDQGPGQALLPLDGFPADPVQAARAQAKDATHALVIQASVVNRPTRIPSYYSPCAEQDRKGACLAGMVPEERRNGGIEARVEVFDLKAGRPVYRAGTDKALVRIGYDEDTAASAAAAVARRVMLSLREAGLL